MVERNPVLLLGINSLLREMPDMRIVTEGQDVAIFGLADAAGVGEVERLARIGKVIVLTAIDSPVILVNAIAAGAHGCLIYGHFDAKELAVAIDAAVRGQACLSQPAVSALVGWLHGSHRSGPKRSRGYVHELTPREAEIMELIAQGYSNRRIAAQLFISEKTVKNHVHQIYRRLRADGREHAVVRWRDINDFPVKPTTAE